MGDGEFGVESDGAVEHLARAFETLAPKMMEQLPASKVQLIGPRVSCAKWRPRLRSRRSSRDEPLIELSADCMDIAQLPVQLTVYGKVFVSFPSLNGANVP